MYERVEKLKENKSRAVANSVAHKKSNVKQGFGFVANRLLRTTILGRNYSEGRKLMQQDQIDKSSLIERDMGEGVMQCALPKDVVNAKEYLSKHSSQVSKHFGQSHSINIVKNLNSYSDALEEVDIDGAQPTSVKDLANLLNERNKIYFKNLLEALITEHKEWVNTRKSSLTDMEKRKWHTEIYSYACAELDYIEKGHITTQPIERTYPKTYSNLSDFILLYVDSSVNNLRDELKNSPILNMKQKTLLQEKCRNIILEIGKLRDELSRQSTATSEKLIKIESFTTLVKPIITSFTALIKNIPLIGSAVSGSVSLMSDTFLQSKVIDTKLTKDNINYLITHLERLKSSMEDIDKTAKELPTVE